MPFSADLLNLNSNPSKQAPTTEGGDITDRIQQVESNGRRYADDGSLLTSPKGAQGEMQVMPDTARDPGFGVTPVRDDSPDELARVGRDYAQAMSKKYGGDPALIAASYNWGPNALDKALATHGDDWFRHAPEETRNYVEKVTGRSPVVSSDIPQQSKAPLQYDTGGADLIGSETPQDIAERRRRENMGITDHIAEGFKRGAIQSQGLVGGISALVADTFNADGVKDWGLDLYQRKMQEAAKYSQNASFTDMMDGKVSGTAWLFDNAGYLGYQALEALLTGGAGAAVGKAIGKQAVAATVKPLVEREVAKLAIGELEKAGIKNAGTMTAAELSEATVAKLGKEGAAKLADQAAKNVAGNAAGAASLFANNLRQEGGSIYGDAADDGKTQDRLGKIWLAALGASMVDTAADKLMLDKALGKSGAFSGNYASRVGKEALSQGAVQGGTEAVQTVIEQAGAGKEIGTPESIRDIVDSTAAGAVGGGIFAPAAGLRSGVSPELAAAAAKPHSPLARAAVAGMEAGASAAEPVVTPASDAQPTATQTDPFAERLAAVDAQLNDAMRVMRQTPGFGPEGAKELVQAFAIARNPTTPPRAREGILSQLERRLQAVQNRPNFTMPEQTEGQAAPGTDLVPAAGREVSAQPNPDLSRWGNVVDADAQEVAPDAALPNEQRKLPAPGYIEAAKQLELDVKQAKTAVQPGEIGRAQTTRYDMLRVLVANEQAQHADAQHIAFAFTELLKQQGAKVTQLLPVEQKLIQRFVSNRDSTAQAETGGALANTEAPQDSALVAARDEVPSPDVPGSAGDSHPDLGATGDVPDNAVTSDPGNATDPSAGTAGAENQALNSLQPVSEENSPSPVDAIPAGLEYADWRQAAGKPDAVPVAGSPEQTAERQDYLAYRRQTDLPEIRSDVDVAAHDAATSPLNDTPQPTDAQKESGEYAKGRIEFTGLRLSVDIENPAGSAREGIDEQGEPWRNVLRDHYGDVVGTIGADGDPLDVFVVPGLPSDWKGEIYVINQKNADGGFDEHKAVIGASSEEDARAIYQRNYSPGWDGILSVAKFAPMAFKAWAKGADLTKPANTPGQRSTITPKAALPDIDGLAREEYAAARRSQYLQNHGGTAPERVLNGIYAAALSQWNRRHSDGAVSDQTSPVQERASVEAKEPQYSLRDTPIQRHNQLTGLFSALGKFDDAFRMSTPTSKDMENVVQEMDPGYRATRMNPGFAKLKTKGRASVGWIVHVPRSNAREAYIFDDGSRVWLDVSHLKPGVDIGSMVYNMAAGYAHNNDRVFIGDPAGLTPKGFYRRLENMISSALKFGTTRHLYPHAGQVDPSGYYQDDNYPDFGNEARGLGFDWKEGDDGHNLNAMLMASYNAAIRNVPELKNIIYDPDSRQFIDRRTGDRFSRGDFAKLSAGVRARPGTRYPGGGTTLARAALVNTLVSTTSPEERRSVLADFGAQLRGRGLDAELGRLLYSTQPSLISDSLRDDRAWGITMRDLRAVTQPILDRLTGRRVTLLESGADLPQTILDDMEKRGISPWKVEGVFHQGELFLVAQNLRDPDRAISVLMHEAAHFGLRGLFGVGLDPVLMQLGRTNPAALAYAEKYVARYSNNEFQVPLVVGVEEYLASLAESERKQLKGWGKFVAYFRQWLRSQGWPSKIESLRKWLDRMDDNDVELLVNQALDFWRDGGKLKHDWVQGMVYNARLVWSGIRTVNDFLLPETPEYDGDMTGDLASVPENNAVPALPVRVEAGIARGPHAGNGMLHLADNASRDSRRNPNGPTDDLAENLMRQVVDVLGSATAVHHDGQGYIFVSPSKQMAVVTSVKNDEYYSVVTARPYRGNAADLWGRAVWNGRLAFPSRKDAETSLPTAQSRQTGETPQSDRDGLGKTEHFDVTNPSGKKQALVTVKKSRVPKYSLRDEEGPGGARDNADSHVAYSISDTTPSAALRTGQDALEKVIAAAKSVGHSSKTLSRFHNIQTQLHKALTIPEFARVMNGIERWQNQIRRSTHNASSRAPDILRGFDSIGEAWNSIKSTWTHSDAMPRVWKMLEAGTLAGDSVLQGRRFTPDELQQEFKATPEEIALYGQARDAIDAGLDESAASVAWLVSRQWLAPEMREVISSNTAEAKGLIADAFDEQVNAASIRAAVQTQMIDTRLSEQFGTDFPAMLASLKSIAAENRNLPMQERIQRGVGKDWIDAQTKLVQTAQKAENALHEVSQAAEQANAIFDKADALKAAGYAPLMRFGKLALTMRDEAGEVLFFGRYETESQLREAKADLDARKPAGATIESGPINPKANELYQGIDPESVALFIDRLASVDDLNLPPELMDAVKQEYLKASVADRSALARSIHRKGTPGFSQDLERVLASFVSSSARMAARNYYNGDILRAINEIPKRMGDVQEEAQKLKEYLDNPQDPWSPMRGVMFAWYMGGSIASAAVNMTQPVMMTFPFLSQYGAGKAMLAMRYATLRAIDTKADMPEDMKAALQRAADDGKVATNEVHNVMQAGMDSIFKRVPGGAKVQSGLRTLSTAWGALFSASESFNRRLSFIAAYKMAKDDPSILKEGQDAYAFALDAVDQTQGIMEKYNRPNWARGTGPFGVVGAAAFTFKQYSIAYVELLYRLLNARNPDGTRNLESMKAGGIMLGTLILASGVQGIPGADDFDDAVDTVLQMLGYNGNFKKAKRDYFVNLLGKEVADVAMYGASSLTPIDIQARMGLGNMAPMTGVLKRTERDSRAQQLGEIFGAPGNLVNAPVEALDALLAGQRGDALGALAPLAFRNAMKAASMLESGWYTDTRGRKVAPIDGVDVAAKLIGFQPNSVASGTRATSMARQDIARIKGVKSDLAALKAQGVFEHDAALQARAERMLADWNDQNPDARIKAIDSKAVARRVRDMNTDRATRMAKSAPKDLRAKVAAELEE